MLDFFKRLDTVLLPLLVCGMAALTYSIFSSSYSSERVTSPQIAPVPLFTQSPREPYVSIVNGISNDFGTDFGPWWLLDPMSKLQVFNPTNQTVTVVLSLRFDKAFCATSREISVTAQNTTKTVTLSYLNPVSITRFRMKLESRSSSLVVVQTSSPVCQVESDPRLFLGEIKVVNLLSLQNRDFNFGSQE